MPNGYTGKILHIDLNSGTLRTDEPEEEGDSDVAETISAEEAISHLAAVRAVTRKEVLEVNYEDTDTDGSY